MQFNIFKVTGAISTRNLVVDSAEESGQAITRSNRAVIICKINTLNALAPDTAQSIASLAQNKKSMPIAQKMLLYASNQFQSNDRFMEQYNECDKTNSPAEIEKQLPQTAYGWANSDEWATLKVALRRDQAILTKAAADAGVDPRLIVASVIGEQFRFFSGTRTAFKNYFEPLKIFGRLSKFSYGIAGLKPETVRSIEKNLIDTKSPFYIGPEYASVAKYTSDEINNHSDPQLARITDPQNNYYSYLYTGLYLHQVSTQWKQSGYDISGNAGVLATLYNLGFRRSIPKEKPLPGGAIITINDRKYTFGQIADEFYWSGELLDEFPYIVD